MKFRKKHVVIEAVQWTGENTNDIITFTGFGLTTETNGPHGPDGATVLIIPTLEGNHAAAVGDWIIRGVRNEYYPCKPDIFEVTYEPVE